MSGALVELAEDLVGLGGHHRNVVLGTRERSHGFQRVELPRYYVPLTYLGRTALRLTLHHRLSDHIPEPVAAQFRTLRRLWYARKVKA